MNDTPTTQSSSRKIGKYQILGVIGTGSMGVVYKGLDPELDRSVAIKTLFKINAKTVLSADSIMERIRTEARFAGNLRHPHIVTIFEIGRDKETPFIVMDFVEGRGLDARIVREQKIKPEEVRSILHQVGSALDYAHRQNVIHRDIKPANILVREGGELDGEVAIVDFGVAAINASLEKTSDAPPHVPVVGSAGYMSPEQIKSERVDARSDLFSAAIVTFECLAGKRPFMGDDAHTVIRNIIHAPPLQIRNFCTDLPPTVDEFFAKALSKNKDERFQTGEELSRAFGRALEGKSLIAPEDVTIVSEKSTDLDDLAEEEIDLPNVDIRSSKGAKDWAEARALARFRTSAILLSFACLGAGGMFVWSALSGNMKPRSAYVETLSPVRSLPLTDLRTQLARKELPSSRRIELLDEALRRDISGIAQIARPFLTENDAQVRKTAVRIVGLRGSAEDLKQITPLLDDPASEVRIETARALASLGDKRGIPALAQRIEVETDAGVHQVMKRSLAKLRAKEGP